MTITIKQDSFSNDGLIDTILKYHDYYHENASVSSQPLATIKQLKDQGIQFWSAWADEEIIGCIGLKSLEAGHGELKCMYIIDEYRGKGTGRALISHVINEAKAMGYKRISVENATTDGFKAFSHLIKECGFKFCSPFGDYFMDMHSQCMTLHLEATTM